MNIASSDIAITIILPEASVAYLIETLTLSAYRFHPVEESAPATENTPISRLVSRETIPPRATGRPEKYSCDVLGMILSGATLPEVFVAVIDVLNDLDPSVLEKLSVMRPSYARNYISRDREKVHIRSPKLETLRTESGWWTSKNISRSQLTGALRALCNAAGLEYGKDLHLL